MNESYHSRYMLVIMKNLNLLTVLYIAVIMAYGLSGYIQENTAVDFLTKIYQIPIVAWKIPVLVICLYGSCLLLLYIQNLSNFGLFLKVCLELGICFCLSYVIGFSYSGVVLLILADVMRYFPKSKWKIPFAVFIILFYLLLDYNLLSVFKLL